MNEKENPKCFTIGNMSPGETNASPLTRESIGNA